MTDYKLVPLEPTAEMMAAGKHALEVGCYVSGIYADMLAASPNPEHSGDSNEMPGWEPIETAPMDGTHIQLYRPKIQFIGYYGGANSGWRHNAPGLDAVWPPPTHWMPLLNPPQQAQGEELRYCEHCSEMVPLRCADPSGNMEIGFCGTALAADPDSPTSGGGGSR